MELISLTDFTKIELCVGTILKAEDFPEAKKPAYKLTIDFGEKGIKKSSAQITKLYTKEKLIGLQIIAVLNFPTKQIANFISECLVLGAVGKDHDVILLTTERPVINGLKIS